MSKNGSKGSSLAGISVKNAISLLETNLMARADELGIPELTAIESALGRVSMHQALSEHEAGVLSRALHNVKALGNNGASATLKQDIRDFVSTAEASVKKGAAVG